MNAATSPVVAAQDAWTGLQEAGASLQSTLLKSMVSSGAFIDMQGPLKGLLEYTDWDQAAERGRIVPHSGSDANFDAAERQVRYSLSVPD